MNRVLILEHDKGTPLSVLADKFNISRRTATRINKERAKWMSVDAGTGKRDKHVLREDVDDVVDDLLAEEGDDDQSDDEAAAAAGPTNSETFATLSEKARAAGQAALALLDGGDEAVCAGRCRSVFVLDGAFACAAAGGAVDAAPEGRAAEADAEAQADSVALIFLQGESA